MIVIISKEGVNRTEKIAQILQLRKQTLFKFNLK